MFDKEERERENQRFLDDLQCEYEARKAEAEKRPSQARRFNSEEEIEQALGRMDPGAAMATRLFTQVWLSDPKAMQNKDHKWQVFQATCMMAIEKVIDPPGGVTNAILLAFYGDHEVEILRVHDKIIQFCMR